MELIKYNFFLHRSPLPSGMLAMPIFSDRVKFSVTFFRGAVVTDILSNTDHLETILLGKSSY